METRKCYDVSFYQKGLILPNDTHHVIIRLGQRNYLDSMCEEFIRQCQEKKINFDFYWYVDTTEVNGLKTEFSFIVKYFNLMCDKYNLDRHMHIWFDLEKSGQDNKIFFLRTFSHAEENKLNYGLYTCWDWYRRIVKDQSAFKDLPIWIAWWGVPVSYVEDIPNIHFHQYGTTKIENFTVDGDTELYCCKYEEGVNEDENKPNNNHGVPLYASAYAETPVTTYNGKFYYYDNEIINGRRRITSDSFYVGKLPMEQYITGFVDVIENVSVPDKGSSFNGSEHRKLFASAYDICSVGITSDNVTYYYYDDEIINGKRRVTVDKNHINDKNYSKYVTGWVNA